MNICLSYVTEGNSEQSNTELAGHIATALGEPLECLIRKLVLKVELDTNLTADWDGLNVRCFRTIKLKQGWCFKDIKHGHSSLPDITLGFTGNKKDFIITLLHELLHLVRWDEQILDEKALEIYAKRGLEC